ncbi:MAG TPA: alpha/beta hydrolase, partial [Paenibacillus sp.]|nr:alpha/beta hydrolase [Paenibacillus sp.]
MIERSRKLTLFALAGVFTASNFLDEFRLETARRCERAGWSVESHSLLPYGDWTRSKLRQSAEIAADVCGPLVGGRRAAADVARLAGDPAACGVVALLGHSGGGVAAAHAADELSRRGYRVGAVAMIGSPKTPIPKRVRDVTAFFYLGNEDGSAADAIARVGGWFGRRPARLRSLALVGGHRDYFRSRAPFLGAEGRSNLETTAEAVAAWVNEAAAKAASPATHASPV